MSKIILIDKDSYTIELIRRISRNLVSASRPVQVEVIESQGTFRIGRRRPRAVVLDVRSPSATIMETFSNLKARRQQVPLILHLTFEQSAERSWLDFFSSTSAVYPYTEKTSESELQAALNRFLTEERPHRSRTKKQTQTKKPSPSRLSSDQYWHEKNDRRIDLIYKERDDTLTAAEQEELAGLQKEAEVYLAQVFPLPFDTIDAWAAKALEALKRA